MSKSNNPNQINAADLAEATIQHLDKEADKMMKVSVILQKIFGNLASVMGEKNAQELMTPALKAAHDGAVYCAQAQIVVADGAAQANIPVSKPVMN